MTMKALDKMAKEGKPMPNGLAMYEQCYYIISRGLYEQYAAGMISLEEARREKKQAVKSYEEGAYQWKLFSSLYTVEEKLKALRNDGFNTALEIEILELLNDILK